MKISLYRIDEIQLIISINSDWINVNCKQDHWVKKEETVGFLLIRCAIMILYIHVLIYDVIEIKRRSITMILIIIGNDMFFLINRRVFITLPWYFIVIFSGLYRAIVVNSLRLSAGFVLFMSSCVSSFFSSVLWCSLWFSH